MKILHIIPNLLKGGAERLVTDIVRELKKRPDIEVRLVLFRNEIEYDIEDIQDVVKIIPASVQLSLWKKNKLNIEALQGFVEKFQPDIIHSHLFEAEIVSRSCLYPKAKWFSHAHGFFKEFNQLNLLDLLNKKNIVKKYEQYYIIKRYQVNDGNTYLAVSNPIKSFIQKIIKSKVLVLHNAIDFNLFNSSNVKKNTSDVFNIISVGRMDKNKNHILQLHIIVKLKEMGVKCNLCIFGEGSNMRYVKDKIEELNLNEIVSLRGWDKNIEQQYPKYDLFLHTAKKEALGLTLIEAMAAGLPVVTLDGIGNRDLIIEGKNGYMIQGEDVHQFASKILSIINNQNLYKKMTSFSTQFAREFDLSVYIRDLLKIYKSSAQ